MKKIVNSIKWRKGDGEYRRIGRVLQNSQQVFVLAAL